MAALTKNMTPIGDRLVVKVEKAEETSKGGILLPQQAQERPQTGEVIEVGKGRMLETGVRIPMEVQVGDRVVFPKFGGTEITVEEEKFMVITEKEILVILRS